jgi:hypothetical protein
VGVSSNLPIFVGITSTAALNNINNLTPAPKIH